MNFRRANPPCTHGGHMHPRHMHFHGHAQGRFRHFVGARMHRKLFASFAAAIMLAGLAAGLTVRFVGDGPTAWGAEKARAMRFVGGRFANVWHDAGARDELARSVARDLEFGVRLRDADRSVVFAQGYPARCRWRLDTVVPGAEGRPPLGAVEMCGDRARGLAPWWRTLAVLSVAVAVLWAVAGKVARKLARPIVELTQVARQIGEGNLSVRADLRCGHPRHDEVGELADAVHEMATRIDRQLREQRELLAAVSHELRTPLARVRLLLEYARDGIPAVPTGNDPLTEIEAEVLEMDALVGNLLATARVDFSALSLRELDARGSALRACERNGLGSERVLCEGAPGHVRADATLLARALAAVLDNAKKYGGGATAVRVRDLGDRVAFEVDDAGLGFVPGDEARVFESFVRGQNARDAEAPGVGLGLALVRRIAEAHGGRAWAETRPEGGARVAIELPRGGPSSASSSPASASA